MSRCSFVNLAVLVKPGRVANLSDIRPARGKPARFPHAKFVLSPPPVFLTGFINKMLHFLRTSWLLCLLLLTACGTEQGPKWYSLTGRTMGTTYQVQYYGEKNFKQNIDALLAEINDAVSTYIPTSVISGFNTEGTLVMPRTAAGVTDPLHRHFMENLEEAFVVYRASGGLFDVTVGPLVEAWGFGSAGRQEAALSDDEVRRLRRLVGMDKLRVQPSEDAITIDAGIPGMRLDFSALAKGYGVDKVFEMLLGEGIEELYVEIGGEIRCSGNNRRGEAWVIGINLPEEHAALTDISARVRLRDGALATSGNYRNVYTVDGRTVWHTLNPRTGYPEENDLLSATVIHPVCMTADALSTACMVMGTSAALTLMDAFEGTEAFFIYRNAEGVMADTMTAGFSAFLID